MSDADLVARLKADANRHLEFDYDEDWRDCHGPQRVSAANLEREAAEYIDRLMRELAEARKTTAGYYDEAKAALAERDRYKAALERIVNVDPETDLGAFYIFAKETAREALAGAGDDHETER